MYIPVPEWTVHHSKYVGSGHAREDGGSCDDQRLHLHKQLAG